MYSSYIRNFNDSKNRLPVAQQTNAGYGDAGPSRNDAQQLEITQSIQAPPYSNNYIYRAENFRNSFDNRDASTALTGKAKLIFSSKKHHLDKNLQMKQEFTSGLNQVKEAANALVDENSVENSKGLKDALVVLMDTFINDQPELMKALESDGWFRHDAAFDTTHPDTLVHVKGLVEYQAAHATDQAMRSGEKQVLPVWVDHFPALYPVDQEAILTKFVDDFLPKMFGSTTTEHDAQRRGIHQLGNMLRNMKDQVDGRANVGASLFLKISELSTHKHLGIKNGVLGALYKVPAAIVMVGLGVTIVGGAAGLIAYKSINRRKVEKESKNRNEGASLVVTELLHMRSVWKQLQPATKQRIINNFDAMDRSLDAEAQKGGKIAKMLGDAGKYMVPRKFGDYWKKKDSGSLLEKTRLVFRT